jgi:hypothetical protein
MRTGLSPFRAKAIGDVARRSAELPSVMGQFADRQHSLDQVAVVTLYAPAQVEASVAELAVNASVPQLRRSLSRYCFDPPAQTGQAGRAANAADREAGDDQADNSAAGSDASGSAQAAGDPPSWNGLGAAGRPGQRAHTAVHVLRRVGPVHDASQRPRRPGRVGRGRPQGGQGPLNLRWVTFHESREPACL